MQISFGNIIFPACNLIREYCEISPVVAVEHQEKAACKGLCARLQNREWVGVSGCCSAQFVSLVTSCRRLRAQSSTATGPFDNTGHI